jgi:membrane associated rhomboid family serine protease
MKTVFSRSSQSSIPRYNQNAVMQLIIASATGFISYHLARVILLIAEANPRIFPSYFTKNLALPYVHDFPHKVWTIFTYGWIHNGFWELFSNMIWLYAFGSIIQMLVGYKEVIPLFVYSLVTGGVFYELSQLIPGEAFNVSLLLFGAQAGLVGLAVASLTISPGYRVYLGDRFSIPLVVIACIFFVLMVMNSNLQLPGLFLLAGGAIMGFSYVKLLQNGYKPGAWVYNISDWLNRSVTPDEHSLKQKRKRNKVINKMYEPKQGITQKRIDDILDKINQHGYNSLTKEEKDVLLKAAKEDNS